MTCRNHWWELWQRPHRWFPASVQLEGRNLLWCAECAHIRITERKPQ